MSHASYNGSYTITAKPITILQLHHTMIQFLIKYAKLIKGVMDVTTAKNLRMAYTYFIS